MSTYNRPSYALALAIVAMAILGFTALASAGTISYVKITGDGDCGVCG